MSAYANMIGQFSKKNKVETGTPRAARVKEITNRLVAEAVRFRPDSANWAWEVQLIDEPKTVNAFCMAGGKMGIYTGFWEKLNATDDEIGNVMGHEIGHALASHTREKMSMAMTVGVGAAALRRWFHREIPMIPMLFSATRTRLRSRRRWRSRCRTAGMPNPKPIRSASNSQHAQVLIREPLLRCGKKWRRRGARLRNSCRRIPRRKIALSDCGRCW